MRRMNTNEITLKGSLYGVHTFSKYKNPDISRAIVDNHVYLVNKLRIRYLENKDKYYIYHSYVDGTGRKYSGRWYNGNYTFSKNGLNASQKTFTVVLKSVEWEDDITNTSTVKDVEIKIYLTKSGYYALEDYFNLYNLHKYNQQE